MDRLRTGADTDSGCSCSLVRYPPEPVISSSAGAVSRAARMNVVAVRDARYAHSRRDVVASFCNASVTIRGQSGQDRGSAMREMRT